MIACLASFLAGGALTFLVMRSWAPRTNSPTLANACGGIVRAAHQVALSGDAAKIRAHLAALKPELTAAAFEAKHSTYNSDERVRLAAVQLAVDLVSAAIPEDEAPRAAVEASEHA